MAEPTERSVTLPALIPAAGASRRVPNANKLLLPIEGRPMLAHTIAACRRAQRIRTVIVVLGHDAERVRDALAASSEFSGVFVRQNPRWREGLSTSLHEGLDALPPNAPGMLVLPGDMPRMTPELVDRVAARALRTGRLSFPTLAGRKGHPTALPRRLFPQLRAVTGDVGARAIVRAHWHEAAKLALAPSDAPTQVEIDTLADARELAELARPDGPA